jgi:hypothetical protein
MFMQHNSGSDAMYCGYGINSGWVGWIDTSSGFTIPLNQWTQITCVIEGGKGLTLYINGTKQYFVSNVGAVYHDSTNILWIGRDSTDDLRYFDGLIDEFAIWNRSLSESEVDNLYRSNLVKFSPSQWYLFVNQSKNATAGLANGNYTFKASAGNNEPRFNSTETRFIQILDNSAKLCSSGTGCIFVRNKTSANVSMFDNNGNLDLRGSLTQSSVGSPDGADLIFKNKTGSVLAWVDGTNGNMRIAGTLTESNGYCTPSTGSFVVRDKTGNCVSTIDSSGNLILRGSLRQNFAM